MAFVASEDMLVGLVTLALIPTLVLLLRRGVRSGVLPIGRSHVRRAERAAAFNTVLAFYAVALVLITAISADLLLNLGLRDRL